jgi:hypothetical protein
MIISSIKRLFDDHLKQFINQITKIGPDCCGAWMLRSVFGKVATRYVRALKREPFDAYTADHALIRPVFRWCRSQ